MNKEKKKCASHFWVDQRKRLIRLSMLYSTSLSIPKTISDEILTIAKSLTFKTLSTIPMSISHTFCSEKYVIMQFVRFHTTLCKMKIWKYINAGAFGAHLLYALRVLFNYHFVISHIYWRHVMLVFPFSNSTWIC